MKLKYILVLHSKQYTFHFRARLAAGLGAARDGGFWLAAKAYEMTSAWARHIEADSERNLRIAASRTCSTSVAGLAPGLTRLSLIASPLPPLSTAAATDRRVSSAAGRAACRDRVCGYGYISVLSLTL